MERKKMEFGGKEITVKSPRNNGPGPMCFDGFTKTVLENASGYSITKIDDNRYSFTASSGTGTSGTKGGGGRVTAGPVTLGT